MRSRNLFITTAYYPFPPLLVSHSPNKLSFIIYFFLIYHFYASFRPPTRVYFQGFLLPASDRQMFFLFSLGRETWPPSRKSCFFFFLSHDSGHLAKNSCPMGAGIHRRGFIYILYLFIYPCLNIDPREQKGRGWECHTRVT